MIIMKNRVRLNQALENARLTVLLLSGMRESKAGKVHDFVSARDLEQWRRCFLITDLTVISEAEKTRWFDGAKTDHYAVVGSTEHPKAVAQEGSIEDLLRSDGRPGIRKIRSAFAIGDQL